MTAWDFTADIEKLLASADEGAGPSSMSGIVEAAAVLVQRGRDDGATALERWLSDNAEALVGQQLLVASVQAQHSPATELPRALREWAAHHDDRDPAAAVAWLKEEHPALLRAWLLSRVEELIAQELQRLSTG